MTTKPKPSDVAHILPALRAHAVRISTLNLDPDNPAYCDVIVDRMTRMGLHPNLDGAAYDEVAKARA